MSRHLHLNAFVMDVGHHEAAWRLPESDPGANLDVEHFVRIAQLAEAGTLDSIFFADGPVLRGDPRFRPVERLDPTLLLAAIATRTEHIGLIATASTSYTEPYEIARRFASLDHISGGRAGWNIVTTAGDDAARNFGRDGQALHHERYERAEEFVEVALKLWDSWQDDAQLADKDAGVYADGDRIRAIEHEGAFFRVAGPLNVSRTPQGRPVLVQAGSSEDGRAFAARHAEAVFTAQRSLAEGQAFYTDLKARTRAAGRHPDAIKILPGIVPVLGATEAEARALERELDELIVPAYGLKQLSSFFGVDLSGAALDGPLPEVPAESEIEGTKSRATLVAELARRESLTVRELIGKLGGGRGHRTFAGTPEQVADTIEEWFRAGAADGFNVMPAVLPSGLERFVEHVVPILRRRGLFRHEYTGRTLREHYGLARPAHRQLEVIA
ncbi:LLM class flavin-dependent oxidoreductase [Solirubrobacter phytolaccae]|uniref:LLM class flavin-dependent oxidoreductase n=1 Tax=Solirubrobacter phytolaccae TaxID=1404360 RepID=A0A9X3ND86_9ACTN|nr:LLM class flavin-dependent oxidoreductase [Solirubrobacter phytolaccae]MDA0183039.1 LLM class flavin-dependent oxidoreductase [Solirubrobacter phytolaccae]